MNDNEELKDIKENEDIILNILNKEYTDDICDDVIVIKGITFYLSNNSIDGEDEETETLTSENMVFNRTGRKIFSYERWTETNWYDWE